MRIPSVKSTCLSMVRSKSASPSPPVSCPNTLHTSLASYINHGGGVDHGSSLVFYMKLGSTGQI